MENRPVGSRSVSQSVSSRSTVGRSVSQSAVSLCNAIIEASSLRNRDDDVKILMLGEKDGVLELR